jgi:hypothetical protein
VRRRVVAVLSTAALLGLAAATPAVGTWAAGAPAAVRAPAYADEAAGSDDEVSLLSGDVAKEALDIKVRGHAAKAATTSPITYHGGPVMTATTGINLYYVWYGSWTTAAKGIIADFGTALGGSPWYGINGGYTDKAGLPVVNAVKLAGQYVAPFTKGSNLSDSAIQSLVSSAISSKGLPADPNGVYVVLTAAGIKASSGFLTKYCGWHTHASMSGKDIKYSFVGDATGSSLSSCAAQTASSPNGNPGVDALISVLAHEVVEAASDPDLNAWYDSSGAENADKCAWTFGTTYAASNGSTANVRLGARDYLIQRNWKPGATQACTLS